MVYCRQSIGKEAKDLACGRAIVLDPEDARATGQVDVGSSLVTIRLQDGAPVLKARVEQVQVAQPV
jgi:hypothetical protein